MVLVTRNKLTPVFYTNGQPCVKLSDGDDDGDVLTGDMDGDGHDELIVEIEKVAESIKVFGRMGNRMSEFMLDMKLSNAVAGDVDGDGRDELLNIEGGALAAYGLQKEHFEVAGWPYGYYPSACSDLDGDGYDEIIACQTKMITPDYYDPLTRQFKGLGKDASKDDFLKWVQKNAAPQGGIFHPKTKEFDKFDFPEANWRLNIFTGERGQVFCVDLDGDGVKEIAAKPTLATLLLIYDRQGNLKYQEEFGKPAIGMAAAHSKGRDYLVVQLEDKLLIYP